MIRDFTYAIIFWAAAIAATYLLTEVSEAGSWQSFVMENMPVGGNYGC